jgi:hypothetical protein
LVGIDEDGGEGIREDVALATSLLWGVLIVSAWREDGGWHISVVCKIHVKKRILHRGKKKHNNNHYHVYINHQNLSPVRIGSGIGSIAIFAPRGLSNRNVLIEVDADFPLSVLIGGIEWKGGEAACVVLYGKVVRWNKGVGCW